MKKSKKSIWLFGDECDRRPHESLFGPVRNPPTPNTVALGTNFSDTFPSASLPPTLAAMIVVCYPAGPGSIASRCTIAPNSPRVRCPSASNRQ